MIAIKKRILVLSSFAMIGLSGHLSAKPMYDLVIHGGRVMNPENQLDGIRDVGIKNGRIAYVSSPAR